MRIKNNIYQFSIFPDFVIQGISTKAFGSMKNNAEIYTKNLNTFATHLGIPVSKIVTAHQTHTNHVEVVTTIVPPLENTDGLITKKEHIFLGIITADCVPVLFCDPKKRIVGIVHAGYKGLLKGIFPAILKSFKDLGSKKRDILVGVGPAIGVCCYSVAKERIALFTHAFPKFQQMFEMRNSEYFLNLKEITRQILVDTGIQQANIEYADICTKDAKEQFYSLRGDTKEDFGEFMSIIGINK